MKLLRLQIENVRGIPHMDLSLKGGNLLIWGPNGSGKSAVVDAVDFLLTGSMARLTGEGTGGVSVAKHGPHILHDAKDAHVTADIRVHGCSTPITIRRCLAEPGTLTYDVMHKEVLAPVLAYAKQGQHALTRRDILKFITARPGQRAEQMQALLNLQQVEEIRKALVAARNQAKEAHTQAQQATRKAETGIKTELNLKRFTEESVLEKVNSHRQTLSAPPLVSFEATQLQAGISHDAGLSGSPKVNVALLGKDVQALCGLLSDAILDDARARISSLDALVARVRSDTKLQRTLDEYQITSKGFALLDDSGRCPLCDTMWAPEELRGHLQNKLQAAQAAAKLVQQIREAAGQLIGIPAPHSGTIQKCLAAATTLGLADVASGLGQWKSNLEVIQAALKDPISTYVADVAALLKQAPTGAPAHAKDLLDRLLSAAQEAFPKPTPEQTAWDSLTRLQAFVTTLEEARQDESSAKAVASRAQVLHDLFLESRDSVLGSLYDEIRDDFVELYRALHANDESGFTAVLGPEGAGIRFDVDFYGHDKHPPNALHSEGHQDSMGVCLYLALSQKLSAGIFDLVVLDDVVMSVDSEHRRNLSAILKDRFASRQFVITTHDATWARQLEADGVVAAQGSVHFRNWSIDAGPQAFFRAQLLWDGIESDLNNGDVSSAAAKLRRGSEEFLSQVCDKLEALVPFRLDNRYELEPLLRGAFSQYGEWLKQAVKAATSWENAELAAKAKEADARRKAVATRTQHEKWGVNASVHYNNWANLSPSDFRPIVNAFKDLHSLFVCSKCGQLLCVTKKGFKPDSLCCGCHGVHYPLVTKGSVESKQDEYV